MGIELINVFKAFNFNIILDDINLEINDGEFICLLGPSGCGKSTMLNLIAGLDSPTSGTIKIDGETISKPGPDRTMMFQESALFPWLNVWDNVMFGMKLPANKIDKAEQELRANKYLEMVNLLNYTKYNIHQISGGMKQRVALARALTLDSKALLMDEPFANLDKQTKNTLRDELEKIWEKTKRTFIYVTHSVEEAMFFADRIVMMSALPGRIKRIIPLDLPRPRQIDDFEFVHIRAEILKELRNEVDRVEEIKYKR
ncbi:MAG: ABC transporter ATP-binding protein [Oscillospiraceae bacterium]|nr:ABC transporter ATP-binding protein [Oscillospiraceae bacterium]